MNEKELLERARKPEVTDWETLQAYLQGKEKKALYVSDCPFRKIGIEQLCDKIPDNFRCGSLDCFTLGVKLLNFDWVDDTEEMFLGLVRSLNAEEKCWLDEVIARYCEKHKQPD